MENNNPSTQELNVMQKLNTQLFQAYKEQIEELKRSNGTLEKQKKEINIEKEELSKKVQVFSKKIENMLIEKELYISTIQKQMINMNNQSMEQIRQYKLTQLATVEELEKRIMTQSNIISSLNRENNQLRRKSKC